MRRPRPLLLLLACLATLGAAAPAGADELVLARVDRQTNVLAQPVLDAPVVAVAMPGDRFQIVAQEGDWLQVQLFHENWFLPRAATTELVEQPRVPQSEHERRAIFRELYAAEAEAERQAELQARIDERGEPDPVLTTFLLERLKLQVARHHDLSVPELTAIAFEGADKAWPAR